MLKLTKIKMSSQHSALKSKIGHLGGVAEDDIPKNTLEIWAGSLNPLYVILSIPAQMSGIWKRHWDQGTVLES